jgi:hypothetical protein
VTTPTSDAESDALQVDDRTLAMVRQRREALRVDPSKTVPLEEIEAWFDELDRIDG